MMAGPSGNHPSGNGHGGANTSGHGPSPAMAAFFAQRQLVTERMMEYYAAGICGLIAIFVVFHWTHRLCVKAERSGTSAGALGWPVVMSSRLVRNVLVRKVPGFRSAGHALVVTGYVATNAAVAFTHVDTGSMANVAHRFGWLALANMAVVVFLALKNTPLAFITAYSYERLNCLHQIAGYTMFVEMVLHAALYTAFFSSQGRLLTIYAERGQIAAILAGFAFLSVVFSATFLRRLWYELFYVTHICCWIVAVVAVGFHQPEIGNKTLVITLIAASMWFSDRLLRACRVLYNSINNEATLHPLPNGGTKIVMKKVPARSEPGKHCFVWIPAVRKFETHPFTIHKSSPVEFTVKARNGFTSDLHKYAVNNPGAAVKASLDGPYGTFPDPMEFDKIVLIAGGGGATFTFGLAINVIERMGYDSPKNIVFIWAVREHENLSWFREQLDLLRTHEHSTRVSLSLYVTRAPSSVSDLPGGSGINDVSTGSDTSSEGSGSPPMSPTAATDPEKSAPQIPASALRWPPLAAGDFEKKVEPAVETSVEHGVAPGWTGASATPTAVLHTFSEYVVKAGRPDAASLIRDAVRNTPRNQRVLVAACGPDGLMRAVRDTTARLIVGDGPAVELHCEQFGW